MLDFVPSPQTPRFALDKHDKVTIGGAAYRPVDVTDAGYLLVRLDGHGVAESFTRSEFSRLVDLGRVQHERDALLPESARTRLEAPAELLSSCPRSSTGEQEAEKVPCWRSFSWKKRDVSTAPMQLSRPPSIRSLAGRPRS